MGGTVFDAYASPVEVDGDHSSDARLERSSCPRVNRAGCYRVTYRVATVHDEARRAAR